MGLRHRILEHQLKGDGSDGVRGGSGVEDDGSCIGTNQVILLVVVVVLLLSDGGSCSEWCCCCQFRKKVPQETRFAHDCGMDLW